MLITVIIVVVVAAVAFFGGTKYQQTQAQGTANGGQFAHGGANGQDRQGGNAGRGRFGGATVGEILSIDANSVTVKLQDGSSKIINISGSTTFSKTDTASKSDLKTGERVAAFGLTNSDGSITAQNVQLNPMFRENGNQDHAQPSQ